MVIHECWGDGVRVETLSRSAVCHRCGMNMETGLIEQRISSHDVGRNKRILSVALLFAAKLIALAGCLLNQPFVSFPVLVLGFFSGLYFLAAERDAEDFERERARWAAHGWQPNPENPRSGGVSHF